MSIISILTFIILLFNKPTYTEIIHAPPFHERAGKDKDLLFYRQKGNLYSITNISNGKKTLGIKTYWGDCYLRIFKIDTRNLKLAIDGFGEVKKLVAENKFNPDNYVYYEKILDNTGYSDSLAYTFLCWRTSYQMSNYGVSNYSYIPNYFYNRKKRIVINKLKKYLKSHPYSSKAIQQIAYLENLSDIVRGGFMGSSVLNDLIFLSGDRD